MARPAPQALAALFTEGFAHHREGRLAEARSRYDAVLRDQPNHFDALHLRGTIAHADGDDARAEALIRKALRLNPSYADAWSNLGQALAGRDKHGDAIEAYDRALALDPANRPARFNRGISLIEQDRFAEALAHFDALVGELPGWAEAHNYRAIARHGLDDFAGSEAAAQEALALRPAFPEALVNRAVARRRQGRHREAAADFEAAFALDPGFDYPRSAPIAERSSICDWRGLGDGLPLALAEAAKGGKLEGAGVFSALAWTDDPAAIRSLAARSAQRVERKLAARPRAPRPAPARDGRLRVAYVSGDFGNHPVSQLLVRALELHDRARFEIHAFSTVRRDDPMATRVRAVEHFHDVAHLTPDEMVAAVRAQQVDLAVDLNGWTSGERAAAFARRLAPVQAGFLGFAATTGAPWLDYAVVDALIVPPGAERDWSEAPVRLPVCHQPNDPTRPIAAEGPSRSDEDLPENGFVFCSFNSFHKIQPEVFACWMRLLDAVPGSVLWLRGGGSDAMENLRGHAGAAGIDPARLVFAPFAEVPEHLARMRLADLFLDTFPYNAHTTASDALFAGLPILTRSGRACHSRVAASLLEAAGLPELITTSLADYEALALALARDPARLGALTRRLRDDRTAAPLFDMARWTRDFERALLAMASRPPGPRGCTAIDLPAER